MYPTGNTYQSAIKAAARYIRARLSAGDKAYTDETEISALTLETGGTEKVIGNAYSAKLTAELQTSDVPVLGAALHAVFLPNGQDANTVPTVPFVLESVDYDADAGVCTVTGYDRMVRLAEHTAAEIDITYPTTIGAYAAAAAALAGLELAGIDWLNADTVLTAAPNLAGTETCREVIAWAAECALGNAHIDRDGKIVIRSIIPAETGYVIDPDLYFESEIGSAYGPINTLVLARLPQNDNVYRSSAADGVQKIALTIADNPFLDAIRDDVIDAMFAQIDGVSVQPYTLDWCGDPALDPGDTIVLTDIDGTQKTALYGGATLEFDGGMRATVEVTTPTNETIQYQKATSTREALRKTQLAVDKANQKIESLVQEIETLPALNLNLSRDNAVVFAPASGTPDLSAASVTLTCTLGGVDQTDAAEITFAPVGLTGSYDAETHIYTVTAMTATTGYVTITAAYDGQTVSKRFTVVQVRNGADGAKGDPGARGDPGADGQPGKDGTDGTDGISVTAMTAHYAASDSGDTAPTDGWSDTMPERDDTQYLWGYYTVLFSDGTTQDTVPYVVAGAGESYTALSDQIQSVVHEYNTKIDQTKAEILQTASETYATADSVSKLETQVEQTAKQIEFRFSDANGRIQDVSSALADNQKLLEEYIRFKGALMELGRSDSDFIAKLSNEKLAFYEGTNEIAYISNNALNITDAEIRRRLSISYVDDSGEITATYDWIVRSNQHITLARRR